MKPLKPDAMTGTEALIWCAQTGGSVRNSNGDTLRVFQGEPQRLTSMKEWHTEEFSFSERFHNGPFTAIAPAERIAAKVAREEIARARICESDRGDKVSEILWLKPGGA